ncbi:MAG: hypothetical protein M3R69_10805, partial [Acidobacteriota bacterium]|nr:hypothetical protein [Acidobacteriota bacterium]
MNNPFLPIAPQNAVVKIERRFRLLRFGYFTPNQLAVFGMYQGKYIVITIDINVAALNSEDAIVLFGPRHQVFLQIPIPTANMSQALGFGE